MKTKIQIKTALGRLLFEYESEDNSYKKAIIQAAKQGACLVDADLPYADLRGANLQDVNLQNANLRWANLQNVNLFNASLQDANLQGANLRDANLQGANLFNVSLQNVNLFNANLRGANLPIYCKWPVSIVDNKIQIGCENKTIKEWDEFFKSDYVMETKRDTNEFKRIEAVYKAYKAYLKHLA